MSLRNLWVIFKHELALYFLSPVVYVLGSLWLLLAGYFYVFLVLLNHVNPPFDFSGQGPSDLSVYLPIGWLGILNMIFIPIYTMRQVAEEVRTGTHELLFTAPIRDWEIIVGKWLASWAVVTLLLLITAIFPLFMVILGRPDIGVIFTSYLGLWLWSGAGLAIGIFASALTQHQMVALFIALFTLWISWFANYAIGGVPLQQAKDFLREIGWWSHYTPMLRGRINPIDLTYFISIIVLSLFLASQVLGSRRWRA